MGLALYYPALARSASSTRHATLPFAAFGTLRGACHTHHLFFMTLLAAPRWSRRSTCAGPSSVRWCGRSGPAVKTFRRKLSELVVQSKASELGTALARRWVDGGVIQSAYLYVDGHMKAYSGKRHLQEVWNSPATHAFACRS